MTRYVLYGGKGGVGKTTCAAATGIASGRRGEATLVVSTDPAHSLSDSFGVDVGPEPTAVAENCWAVEVDPESRMGRYRGHVSAALDELESLGITLGDDAIDDIADAGIAPGTDEAAALDLFVDYMDDPRYDRIVFDTAPTGHTLRLLELPAVLQSALGTLANVKSQMSSLADTVRGMFGTDENDDDGDSVDVDLQTLSERLERVGAALRDPERTAFRVVLVPETMAIRESERLFAELDAYGVPAGRAVVNKVIEDPTPGCERCQTQYADQQERLKTAAERFDVPIAVLPELDGEVQGLDAVETIADRLDAIGDGFTP
ncbi:ArsA family ATPase [Natronomonas pharaonis DSM 2160]|uniref:ArsA family ATPase n=1 Tax=Natronomonas pharaonis (strain ATCC 35678 / DSM 2160 / CIP 103997 / JCM 8858 / NBRC 14720 / NCIMB 2260 / Gabara) TaxID=348780 RepID=A0A1U7EUV5_NATPD|nr:TRC40/GET3/ArsA family transport-energizing ATPase [Natronomonas pharaonis]CAI48782.1 ArsA family ATPase [Natronomonas pharaonis DSM 2160]